MATKEITITPLYYDYALESNHQIVILLGGRFSGKSQNEQIRLVSNLATKEDYKLLVIEDLETGMADGFHAGLRARISEFEQEQAYNPSTRTAYIKNQINNNEALFRGYATDQQKLNVKKLDSITEIVVEEGEWLDHNSFMGLFQQLRGGRQEDRKLTILLNPVNPECYINTEFILKEPTKVFEYFPDEPSRPKVFEKDLEIPIGDNIVKISVLIVISTHYDNPFLTDMQRASIEDYKRTDPDKYEQLGRAKFIYPTGSLITERNSYSLSRLNLNLAARMTAIVDTASSGSDSATLGIYAKFDEESHNLVDVIKDPDDAKKVIPRMVTMINKYMPQYVLIEKNHEGLYFESEIRKGIHKSIIVKTFNSSENKHEKILGQAGRINNHLYVRDDAGREYNDFVNEIRQYNKDTKVNKKNKLHDDCIDNAAMYFKHGNISSWRVVK